MDHDPDIALPSIEVKDQALSSATDTPPQSKRLKNADVSSRTTNTQRLDSSPVRTPFRTPRSRPSTPGSTSTSRSPSITSVRNDRSSTPKLATKRSVPNLTVQHSLPSHQPQFRRASSNLNPATSVRIQSMERPSLTPASVAKDYFNRELQESVRSDSKVVVITNDACYGHRFARPRSTKATLGSIVERPERIHATLLGASTAYVRLGERHSDGKHPPHPRSEIARPPFALIKSSRSIALNNPAVTAVHGMKWMESLQVMCDSAEAKLAMGQKELARPIGHTKDAKGVTMPPLHSGDLYLAGESLAALQGCLGGVCDAVDTVFQPDTAASRAFVCIRPPGHHCSSDMPSGFCWLNNVHVGISYAAMHHGLTHAAIIDFDLHHGDGSQTITWDHNRDANNMQNPKSAPAHKRIPVGYYSLHDINSYPCEYGDEDKVRNASTCLHTAHGQSIWNVHLESWKSHEDFWNLYQTKYKVLLDKAQHFLRHHSDALRRSGTEPKAAIFLSAGFDASEWESEYMQRHQVNVPTDFYARFTADVVKLSNQQDLGVNGRIISVLEGGYSDRALTSGVLSHLCGLTCCTEEERRLKEQHGLGQTVSGVNLSNPLTYDPAWWHSDQLELLEVMVAGLSPQLVKPKDKAASSYSSPTHASTAKMTEVAKERKSLSAQMEAQLRLESAPLEPIPDVDWVTAAYELSRLLIPNDRQTESCTHEELNAENSRARRDRQSLAGSTTGDVIEDKMQLRDRRPKQTRLDVTQPRTASRSTNRRTTIAAASELPDPSVREPSRTRRRSSGASSVMSSFHDLKLENTEKSLETQTSTRTRPTAVVNPEPSLPLRKTRVPTKKPASAANSPRKSRAAGIPLTQSDKATAPFKSTSAAASGSDVPPRSDDLDDLTNGMKKISIKLKLPTEEEHKANQRRAEELNAGRAKPARKPPIPKISRTKVVPTEITSTVPSVDTQIPLFMESRQAAALLLDPTAQQQSLNKESQHDGTTILSQQSSGITASAPDLPSATESKTQPALDLHVAPGHRDVIENTASQALPKNTASKIIYPSIEFKIDSDAFLASGDVGYPEQCDERLDQNATETRPK